MEDRNEARVDLRLSVLPADAALSPRETAARLTLFGQMADAFPRARTQDTETVVEAYLELTADIPFDWLVAACKRLMLTTTFLPTVAEIRHRAALEIVRTNRGMSGKDPDRQADGQPVVVAVAKVDHWIGRGRAAMGLPEIPEPTTAVVIPAGLAERIERIGAGTDG